MKKLSLSLFLFAFLSTSCMYLVSADNSNNKYDYLMTDDVSQNDMELFLSLDYQDHKKFEQMEAMQRVNEFKNASTKADYRSIAVQNTNATQNLDESTSRKMDYIQQHQKNLSKKSTKETPTKESLSVKKSDQIKLESLRLEALENARQEALRKNVIKLLQEQNSHRNQPSSFLSCLTCGGNASDAIDPRDVK